MSDFENQIIIIRPVAEEWGEYVFNFAPILPDGGVIESVTVQSFLGSVETTEYLIEQSPPPNVIDGSRVAVRFQYPGASLNGNHSITFSVILVGGASNTFVYNNLIVAGLTETGGFSMADWLEVKEPDSPVILNINPSNVIQITPQKNQELIFTDDPTVVVPIEYSSASSYLVPLFFKGLIQSKAKTILDIWNDPTKGNGFARTFYWYNVEDGQTYVVRMVDKPVYKYYPYGRCDVSLTLRVEGKYVA